MVAYSFKPQFVEPIRAGLGLPTEAHVWPKRQTIRADRKRHARPGEELQLYRGMRTRQCFLIGPAECTMVLPIRIDFARDVVEIDYDRKIEIFRPGDLGLFARDDGFADYAEMRDFWRVNHGDAPFAGVIIRWKPRGSTA